MQKNLNYIDGALKVQQTGAHVEVFYLQPNMPRSLQRGANTIGLVIAQKRAATTEDVLAWYCEKCNEKL